MKGLNTELLRIAMWLFYMVIITLLMLSHFFINYLYYTESVFRNTYAEQLTLDRIAQIFETQKEYRWIMYVLMPVILIIKVWYNTCVVSTGSLLIDSRANFSSNFNVCLKAECVFVIMLLVKFLMLAFFIEVNTLEDIGLVPGALANLYDIRELPKWAVYPLQTLNIWEILFCWIGAELYALQFGVSKSAAFQRFCVPYLLGLFIWVLVVVFITLQLS